MSRTLSLLWAFGLVVLSVGIFFQKLSVSADEGPLRAIDPLVASGFLVLAALTLYERRSAIIFSCAIFLTCAVVDGWGLIANGDSRFWPGASVALFGAVFVIIKLCERRSAQKA
jgi:hypothetical protein